MAPPPNSGDATNKNDDDPLGGMDPMAWLESLAARQGANPEELVTAANLDIPVLPEDTVIDEPGYTPGYDTGKMTSAKTETPRKPEPAKAVEPPPPQAEPVMAAASDDPLGGMDPMAWLESLAARQGANPEELVTAANLDIPVLPEDTVIDEPGYTPGYDTGKMTSAKTETPRKPEPAKAVEPPPPQAEPVMAAASDDPLGGMDPMAWLESLAARQGANPEELVTAANLDIPVLPEDTVIDEPGYTPGYDTGKMTPAKTETPRKPEPAKAVEPPPPQAEPVMAAASDDPLGGMDPMAWLESLAARQGANLDELVTAHDLNIPVMPADTVIDEPGYVDYDPFGSGVSRGGEALRAPEPTPESTPELAPAGMDDLLGGMDPLAWLESLTEGTQSEETVAAEFSMVDSSIEMPVILEAETPEAEAMPSMSFEEAAELLGIEPVATVDIDDPLGGMDPLAWLESLAARQGANLDELVTGGTLDLPESPQGEGVETDYSPFAAMTETPGGSMAPESALSWLEELAKEQAGAMQLTPPEAEAALPSDAGGSSQDINEVQAWLFEQARNLELTRDALEAEDAHAGELAPAEPAEMPDWLAGSISQVPAASSITPALSNEISTPIAPSDLPSWLSQPEPDSSLEDILDALQATSAPAAPPVEPEPMLHIATSELEALVRPSSPEEIDSWAEALDEEYERRLAGDESVPDWYQEAVTRAEAEPEAAVASQSAEEISASEMFGEPLGAGEGASINWLEETPEAAALPGEVPDWLRGMAQPVETPAAPVSVPAGSIDWLPDLETEDLSDLPDWLKPAAQAQTLEAVQVPPQAEPPKPAVPEVPVKPPEPVQQAAPTPQPAPTPAPQPAPVAPKPVVQPIVQRAAPPAPRPAAATTGPAIDHPVRLKQARELVTTNQYAASLEHYQVLIDGSQLLEEARGDLRDLVEKNPADPKLRRLLGDTHMRLGDLQAALDTYRSALDQL